MITISLVLVNGSYVGMSHSDRWNLATLLADFGVDFDRVTRKGQLDGLRKRLKALGFKASVRPQGTRPTYRLTEAELDAFAEPAVAKSA